MVWLIAIFIPLYWWHEPARQEAAVARIKKQAMARGAKIFASNCAACHGETGDSIPDKNLSKTLLEEAGLAKVISRGRPDAGMPAWSDEEGGPLKKFEISDVIIFMKNWDQSLFKTDSPHLSSTSTTLHSPGVVSLTPESAPKATAPSHGQGIMES